MSDDVGDSGPESVCPTPPTPREPASLSEPLSYRSAQDDRRNNHLTTQSRLGYALSFVFGLAVSMVVVTAPVFMAVLISLSNRSGAAVPATTLVVSVLAVLAFLLPRRRTISGMGAGAMLGLSLSALLNGLCVAA